MLPPDKLLMPRAVSDEERRWLGSLETDHMAGYAGPVYDRPGINDHNRDMTGHRDKLVILGSIQWLLAFSKPHRHYNQAMIQERFYPSVSLNMFRLYFAASHPVAFVNWAWVDEDIDRRLSNLGGHLRPNEWASGQHLWITEIVAPFGHSDQIIWDFSDLFAFGGVGKSVFAHDDGSLKAFRRFRFPKA